MSIWLAVAVALLPGGAHAVDRANIEAFLKVTGFDVALDSIAYSASDAPALLGMAPDDFGHEWTRVSQEVFDTALMRGMAIDMLERTLDEDMLGHAAGFYASDLGRKLVEVENASHANEDSTAKHDTGAALLAEAERGDPARVEALERLNLAVDSAGHAVRAMQEIMIRFMVAASQAGVLDYRIDEDSLRAIVRADEDAMRAEMMVSGIAHAAFTYRDVTNAEILAYAEALEHPTMQKVYELMNAIQFEIMANRFEALAIRMADIHAGEEL